MGYGIWDTGYGIREIRHQYLSGVSSNNSPWNFTDSLNCHLEHQEHVRHVGRDHKASIWVSYYHLRHWTWALTQTELHMHGSSVPLTVLINTPVQEAGFKPLFFSLFSPHWHPEWPQSYLPVMLCQSSALNCTSISVIGLELEWKATFKNLFINGAMSLKFSQLIYLVYD